MISEEAALWAFIGPPQGNNPTLELVGEGSDPGAGAGGDHWHRGSRVALPTGKSS